MLNAADALVQEPFNAVRRFLACAGAAARDPSLDTLAPVIRAPRYSSLLWDEHADPHRPGHLGQHPWIAAHLPRGSLAVLWRSLANFSDRCDRRIQNRCSVLACCLPHLLHAIRGVAARQRVLCLSIILADPTDRASLARSTICFCRLCILQARYEARHHLRVPWGAMRPQPSKAALCLPCRCHASHNSVSLYPSAVRFASRNSIGGGNSYSGLAGPNNGEVAGAMNVPIREANCVPQCEHRAAAGK
jgi:hypothetical protein